MSILDDNNTTIYHKILVFFDNNINEVRDFVEIATKYKDLEIRSGRWIIDAQSFLGILSLDLSEPVALIYPEDMKTAIERDFVRWIYDE